MAELSRLWALLLIFLRFSFWECESDGSEATWEARSAIVVMPVLNFKLSQRRKSVSSWLMVFSVLIF